MGYIDFTKEQIDSCVAQSAKAFQSFRLTSPALRNRLLHAISSELEKERTSLVTAAARETNLTEVRLNNELSRTIFQLESYGDACEQGYWLEASIDQDTAPNTAKPVIKTLTKSIEKSEKKFNCKFYLYVTVKKVENKTTG